jgi:sorbitol-specific phosphotransferase system component IIC
MGKLLHMPLLITFNYFLAEDFQEAFSALSALSTKVFHTLFKGGNASEFDNYKGITVGLIIATLALGS